MESKSFIEKLFFPDYDEASLFVMSISVVILFFISADFRSKALFSLYFFGFAGFILMAGGLVLSLFHIFSHRRKSGLEKRAMLFFAIVVNAFSAWVGGLYILRNTTGWMIVFPTINIVTALFLLFLFLVEFIDERVISDKDYSPKMVIPGAVLGLAILMMNNYAFKLYWAVNLCICVGYATVLNDVINDIFSGTVKA